MTAASAYPPTSSPEMVEGRPPEPSMEDILASIRRIIADDQGQAGRASPAPRGAEADRVPARARTPYDDVLDLARLVPSADRGAHQAAGETQPPRNDDVSMTGQLDNPSAGLRARLPEPAARAANHDQERDMLDHPVPAVSDEDDLLSPPLGESVMSAFETLAATVVLQNTPMLERVMRDLLRPMLKTWLDDNLPGLVERLVRGEIERVARGTRG